MIEPNTLVRFTGGKFNGLPGIVCLSGDSLCSVLVEFEKGKQSEVVEEIRHLTPQAKEPAL